MVFVLITLPQLLSAQSPTDIEEAKRYAEEALRLAKEMVEHGRDGHADEVFHFGTDLIKNIERMTLHLQKAASAPESSQAAREKGEKAIELAQEALRHAEDAVELAVQNHAGQALHHSRQALHSIRESHFLTTGM